MILRAIAERKLDVNAEKNWPKLVFFFFFKKCTLWIYPALKSLCLKSFLIFSSFSSFFVYTKLLIRYNDHLNGFFVKCWTLSTLTKARSRITFTQQQTTKNLFNLFPKSFFQWIALIKCQKLCEHWAGAVANLSISFDLWIDVTFKMVVVW